MKTKAEKQAQIAPWGGKATTKATAPIYTPGTFVLVRFGSHGSQLGRVTDGPGGTTIQKWRSRSATWSAAKVIPARDILCAAPAGDARLTAAKAHALLEQVATAPPRDAPGPCVLMAAKAHEAAS